MSGEIFYVDLVNGTDFNVGLDTEDAVKTMETALRRCVSGRGDMIYILDNSQSLIINENITITKSNVTIMGESISVKIKSSAIGSAAITIAAANTRLINLTVEVLSGGTDDAITITDSNSCTLRNVRVENATNRGIAITTSDKVIIEDSFVGYSTSHGIEFFDCQDNDVKNCHIDTNGGDNLKFNATGAGATHEVIIRNSIIHEAGGYGANIGANCETIQFLDRCKFILNTTADILDNGITTFNENDQIRLSTVDSVWDEATADHVIVGSTGEAVTASGSGGGPSAAAIADAVWDEAALDHVAVGSAGEALKESGAAAASTTQIALDTASILTKVKNLMGLYFGGLK